MKDQSENAHGDILLDIRSNRASAKYTIMEQFMRIGWACVLPLFRWSPRPFFGWRNLLLRLLGANLGKGVHIYPTVQIFFPWNLAVGDFSAIGEGVQVYNLGKAVIGRNVTISHNAHLCGGTHDYTDPTLPLIKSPITIDDEAWICADAFVGPGVRVGRGAIVAARAVAIKDVAEWSIVGGNPATFIKVRAIKSEMG